MLMKLNGTLLLRVSNHDFFSVKKQKYVGFKTKRLLPTCFNSFYKKFISIYFLVVALEK
jgi:hypothetical protein